MNATTENAVVNSDEKADRDIPKLNSTKKKNNLSRMAIAGGMIVGVVALATGSVIPALHRDPCVARMGAGWGNGNWSF